MTRVLVISDIHANITALEAVLANAGKVDEVWCLGGHCRIWSGSKRMYPTHPVFAATNLYDGQPRLCRHW